MAGMNSYSQTVDNFDNPWKAKSNEGILEWHLENLDSISTSLLLNLFDSIGIDKANIQWINPTDVFYTLHEKGWDYYSRKVYFVDTKDKKIITHQKNSSENKLPNSLFNLSYYCKKGETTLVLVEYY